MFVRSDSTWSYTFDDIQIYLEVNNANRKNEYARAACVPE